MNSAIASTAVSVQPPSAAPARAPLAAGFGGDGTIIALHCSGSSAAQWRRLGEAANGRFEIRGVDFYGCGGCGGWSGEGAFALADEALRVLAVMDGCAGPVHLVGHSYGGAVALQAALRRPEQVASLALYEPTVFHLLRHSDRDGDCAYGEIAAVAAAVSEGVLSGDYRGAAARFVDYWNGAGCWAGLSAEQQAAVLRWVAKGPLEFRALFDDPTPPSAYAALPCPVLMMHGQLAPDPTRLVAERLASWLPHARIERVAGAGHMGPITHAGAVNSLILDHAAIAAGALAGPAAGAIAGRGRAA